MAECYRLYVTWDRLGGNPRKKTDSYEFELSHPGWANAEESFDSLKSGSCVSELRLFRVDPCGMYELKRWNR